jgi:hypothetical protein
MLYGTHGIGKSTWAANSPNPLFIQTEDGIGDIDCDRLPLCESWSDVVKCVDFAASSDHSTIVIDSLDWVGRFIESIVCKDKSVSSISEISWGGGPGLCMAYWQMLIGGLDVIYKHGKSVILVAHAGIEKVTSPYGDSWDHHTPKLHKTSSSYIQEWCDEVLFATYKVTTKQVDAAFGEKRDIPITSSRILYTTEKPAHVAKNRSDLPDSMPFEFAKFAELVPCFRSKGE